MSRFYRWAFKTTFKFVGMGDKKKHKLNTPRDIETKVFDYFGDGKDEHLLNVFLPKEENNNHSLIIDIHGGAWVYGDKDTNSDFCKFFAEQGYTVICPTYSLILYTDILQIVKELSAAIDFVNAHLEEFNIDPSKIHFFGDSAGGQLVLLYESINQSETLWNVYGKVSHPFEFASFCLQNPAPYLTRMVFIGKPQFLEKGARKTFFEMYCGTSEKKEEIRNICSLENYIDEIKHLPPVFITTSEGDIALKNQSHSLVEDLTDRGFDASLYVYPDEDFPHVYNVTVPDSEGGKIVNSKILEFLSVH